MPHVLTTHAVITCPHGGTGVSFPMHPLWSVEGGTVLVENDTGLLTCPFVPYPCSSYILHSMRLNATLIDGLPVILSTDFNQTNTGLPLTMMVKHATLDESTAAPIPAGQAAPPLSLAAADVVPPMVSAVPKFLACPKAAPPPTLSAVFHLAAPYPLRWILTLLNLPERKNQDLTTAQPLGLTLDPSDGKWNSTTLTVTLKMTADYLATLNVGHYHFYMTGVSQRGLSGNDFVDLNVT
jgi:hypothetical protein